MNPRRIIAACLFLAAVGMAPSARADQTPSFTVDFMTVPGQAANAYIFFNSTSGVVSGAVFSPSIIGQNTPLNSGGTLNGGWTTFYGAPVSSADATGGFSYGIGGSGYVAPGAYSETPPQEVNLTLMGGTVKTTGTAQGASSYAADFSVLATLSSDAAAHYGLDPAATYAGTMDFTFHGPPQSNGFDTFQGGELVFSQIMPNSVPEPASIVMLSVGGRGNLHGFTTPRRQRFDGKRVRVGRNWHIECYTWNFMSRSFDLANSIADNTRATNSGASTMLTTSHLRRSARPQIELLDERTLPSAGMTVAVHAAVVEARREVAAAKVEVLAATQATSLANRGMFENADAKALAVLAKTPPPTSVSSAAAASLYQGADAKAAAVLARTPHPGSTLTTSSTTLYQGADAQALAVLAHTPHPSTAAVASTAVPVTAVTAGTTTAATTSTPSPTTSAVAGSSTPTFTPTSANVTDTQNGPLAKAGGTLATLYNSYETFIAGGGTAANFTSSVSGIEISGNMVGVDLSAAGNLSAYEDAVQALGMTVQNVDTQTGTVEGMLPISQLLAVAQLSTTANISPIYTPVLRSGSIR